jgi:hypothetical protein
MTDETPDTKTLKKCFRYLSKRHNWTVGFYTETYHWDIELPRRNNPTVRSVSESVALAELVHTSSDDLFRLCYESHRKDVFPSIHLLLQEYRDEYSLETMKFLRDRHLPINTINESRAKSWSPMSSSFVIENPTKDHIQETGLHVLYNLLTSGKYLFASKPALWKDGTAFCRYLPMDFPRFKTLEELIIKLDLMDFKPETYTFKINGK